MPSTVPTWLAAAVLGGPTLLLWRARRQLRAARAESELLRRDPVTGLLTRGPWTTHAQHLLPLLDNPCVVIADLNRFKAVNDRYSHRDGDTVLAAFADALTRYFGPYALIGRIGGDEFAILTHGDPEQLEHAGQHCLVQARGITCGAAFGYAYLSDLPGKIDAPLTRDAAELALAGLVGRLLHAADLANRRAKRHGRQTGSVTSTARYIQGIDPIVPKRLDPLPRRRHRDH